MFMRKKMRLKRGGDNVEERLLSVNLDRAGCEEIDGEYNKKAGQCDIRQLRDKENPDEVVHKKFDSVKRSSEIGGIQKVEEE